MSLQERLLNPTHYEGLGVVGGGAMPVQCRLRVEAAARLDKLDGLLRRSLGLCALVVINADAEKTEKATQLGDEIRAALGEQ